ncbi:hypothetical protein FA13DRAFT_1622212 [Coprinellus micaceus]|uniref:protein-histidine N-methyltransferase n=1 Tax=Coprinellus micaceus TaxID=71717 RepID=A0A4Y7TT30_COPMI|nr:hypothetical protein FA13DRAFT_1622212 [Coprinellus micaceus]
MSFKFDFDIDDIDEELDSTLQIAGSQPSEAKDEAHPTIPSQEHSIEQFLDALPTLISYSPISISIPQTEGPPTTVNLVRRDLFDARFQLIADGTVDPDAGLSSIEEEDEGAAEDGDGEKNKSNMDPKILEYLDAPSDLLPGVYEGGLKTWECSLDLVEYLESKQPFSSYGGKRVIELGCGTAIPSLYVLFQALSEESTDRETHIHLQDYNASVLELVTFPNVLLTWCTSPLFSPQINQILSPVEPTDQSPASSSYASHPDAELIDPTGAGELSITPELKSAFLASLKEHNIHLRFFSGAWESFDLSKSGSGGEYNLILTSETIYRQESLGSLLHLLDEGSAPGGDLNALIRDEGIRKTESGYLCLVAAKVLYFGVGGGISDFIETVQSRKPGRSGTVSTVLEKTAGIGRKVLRVEWC